MFEKAEGLQNWEVISKFARRFHNGFNHGSSQDIFAEIKTVNRLYKSVLLNEYWNQNHLSQNLVALRDAKEFLYYTIDITPFEPEKPSIHYSDYFYREKIKKLLI